MLQMNYIKITILIKYSYLYISNAGSMQMSDGIVKMDPVEDQDRKIVLEFCHLLEKSKQLFNGLRYVLKTLSAISVAIHMYHINLQEATMFKWKKFLQRFAAIWSSSVAGVLWPNIWCIYKTMEIPATASAHIGLKVWAETMADRRNS